MAFSEEVVLVVQEDEKQAIRVVKWGTASPRLAKQVKFEQDGKIRTGKIKGLTADDFQILLDNKGPIMEALISQ